MWIVPVGSTHSRAGRGSEPAESQSVRTSGRSRGFWGRRIHTPEGYSPFSESSRRKSIVGGSPSSHLTRGS